MNRTYNMLPIRNIPGIRISILTQWNNNIVGILRVFLHHFNITNYVLNCRNKQYKTLS